MSLRAYFPTWIDHGRLPSAKARSLNSRLLRDVAAFRELDREGQAWSKKNYRGGYTSYGTLASLHRQSSVFEELEILLNGRVKAFARAQGWDLQGGALAMTRCWINVMPAGAHHSQHLHPLSVVSGTYYLEMPPGASALRFEDPRISGFMARPPLKASASAAQKPYLSIAAKAGDYVLFESWLKHEVPVNESRKPRISISFNYEWI